MKKKINTIFIIIIGLSLITGFAFILIAPVDINENENRYAEKLAKPLPGNIAEGVFQDSVELTAADQLPLSSQAKDLYNRVFSSYTKACLDAVFKYDEENKAGYESASEDNDHTAQLQKTTDSAIDETTDSSLNIITDTATDAEDQPDYQTGAAVSETTESAAENPAQETKPSGPSQEQINASSDRYVSLGGGVYLYRGRLVQSFTTLNANRERGQLFLDNINNIAASYPDINFYCYYIEKESDCLLTTGQKSGFYEFIRDGIKLPEGHIDRLAVNSYEDYAEYFYETDHHWSYKGSYNGYTGILAMLKPGEQPLVPTDELRIGICKGSLANTEMTSSYSEIFYAYEIPYPSMEISSGGKACGYGSQASFIEKARNGKTNQSVAYWSFYGADVGEIIFHNPSGTGSLLVFGNSYDNAVLKLIASHYEYTYSIDLRYYEKLTGKKFSFADYTADHHIDDVLTMGSSTYFVQAPFRIPE